MVSALVFLINLALDRFKKRWRLIAGNPEELHDGCHPGSISAIFSHGGGEAICHFDGIWLNLPHRLNSKSF